jgi:hypothetical protein
VRGYGPLVGSCKRTNGFEGFVKDYEFIDLLREQYVWGLVWLVNGLTECPSPDMQSAEVQYQLCVCVCVCVTNHGISGVPAF